MLREWWNKRRRPVTESAPDPQAGLIARVQGLCEEGRRRTAMDEVLRELRHPTAERRVTLKLAQAVLTTSRTQNLLAAEPMTEGQSASALVAELATECSICHGFWYSKHSVLPPGSEIQVVNPIGLQCQACRYTLCRRCLERTSPPVAGPVDMPRSVLGGCPTPGHGRLTTPVLPTGRHDVPPVAPDGVEGVIVARNGPVLPVLDDALAIVAKFLPLIASDAPLIHLRRSRPGLSWDESGCDELARSLVGELEREGVLRPGAWGRSTRIGAAADGGTDTEYLITMVRRPGS